MPMARAPQALPWAISARIRLVPSCAAVIFTVPRASRMVTTSGLNFFSRPLASAASRILRATSRDRSVINFSLGCGRLGSNGLAVEADCEKLRCVQRTSRGAILDLVPAGGAVGDDEGRAISAANRGQKRQLGDLNGGIIGVGAIAKGACHATAAGLDDLDSEIGNKAQRLLDRLERAEGFLMAVAVHQHFAADRAERQLQAACLCLAHQKFLEQ